MAKNVVNMVERKVTTLEDLLKYAEGMLVELPPFANDQPFIARLIRPSMMDLVKSGKIPNELLVSANSIFEKGMGGAFDPDNEEMLKQMFDLMDIMCEAAFVSPSWDDIKTSGIKLTDEQLMFVFEYSQAGVKALKSFREEQTNS